MKKILTVLMMLMMVIAVCGCGSSAKTAGTPTAPGKKAEAAESIVGKKTLIAYFSLSGNTETAAKDAQKIIGKADLFKIETIKTYPASHDYAKKELENNELPALKVTKTPNLKDYEVVFIGYPIWWHEAPMAVFSWLKENDLSGKTVLLFCTSGGNQIDQTLPRLHKALPNSKIIDGPTINRPVGMDEWLEQLGYVKK